MAHFYADALVELPKFTRAKSEVIVTIETTTDITIYRGWSETTTKKFDEIEFGETKSKDSHNYQESKSTAAVLTTYEYDPNTLIDEATWKSIYEDEDLINNIWLKITYKDQEGNAVYAPISSFFGFGAYGMFETLGLMVGLTEDGTMYSYYPMPFEAGIKIELVNLSTKNISNINVTIGYENNYFEAGTYGYFKQIM